MSPTPKHFPRSIRWEIWPLLVMVLWVAGCTVAGSEMSKQKREPGEPGKKIGSGLSYAGQTSVEATPTPAAASGWDSERVASGQDDWEPAVAADPGNANYIYQLVTRYTGPKPCGNCKMPAIVLRRSVDGGASFTEQFLSVSGRSQYDPQIAVAANGDVYYATSTQIFRLAGGSGTPIQIVGGLSGPHGLAVTVDGGLLVSDTGHARVVRVDLATGKTETWGDVVEPRSIALAPDGTAYVVDASAHTVVHLTVDGRRLGSVKHVFYDPYAVAAAADGSLYVVDTAVEGRLYRVAPDGTTTVVSRSG